MKKRPLIAFIVPTGTGASIGGFAGDASFWAREFSKHFDLIVNPNVVNAGCFSGINDNMLYLEGFAFDKFVEGKLNIEPTKDNKIGVIFDSSISKEVLNVHINTINAVKTVYGIDIPFYEITKEPVGVNFEVTNISMGSLMNPKTLLQSARSLIKKGAQALAAVCAFKECQGQEYMHGYGVDPVGGVEAIISHYLTKELNVPVAHSPAFEDLTIETQLTDPRAASEYITPTYLPCILIGLSNAPKINQGPINSNELKAIIMPYNCLGSPAVLSASQKGIPILAIKENKTVLDVTKTKLKINGIIEFESYLKALNYLKEKYEKE